MKFHLLQSEGVEIIEGLDFVPQQLRIPIPPKFHPMQDNELSCEAMHSYDTYNLVPARDIVVYEPENPIERAKQ